MILILGYVENVSLHKNCTLGHIWTKELGHISTNQNYLRFLYFRYSMVQNYKKKKGDPVYNEEDNEDMQASIHAVWKQITTLWREAAANYGMSHTALYYRLKMWMMMEI